MSFVLYTYIHAFFKIIVIDIRNKIFWYIKHMSLSIKLYRKFQYVPCVILFVVILITYFYCYCLIKL